jgi:hypothetical protein
MSDVTIESLLEAVVVAQRRRDESREAESAARREATNAENALIEAEKAAVDFMAKQHPRLADEMVKRRQARSARVS